MTKTYEFLLKFLPKKLVNIILYLWYTGLILLVITYSDISPVNFIYYGH